MKQAFLLLIFGFTSTFVVAQDIIIKRNGVEIKSRVIEITSETIKYKDFEFLDGPLRNANISDVFMVIYENGKRETFTPIQNQSQRVVTANEVPVNYEIKKKVKKYKGNCFMIGTGYGNSYGGIGLRVQGRFGGIVGVGIHGGVGYLPGASVLAAGGVKFFPYKGLYINTQFGLTGYEGYSEYYGGSYPDFSDNHLLYGPSLLVGVDQVWGRKVGFGFNAGLGASYNMNAVNFSSFTLAMDLGFVVRF